ncbi:thiamine phosphate synthase [Campylobacter cuniculorum]|uniref:thiamine phosphate synthase n=1 Tax=Campylobacter cuniculorum TaxID=374106 RepID=UPI0023F16291|nr:thiamine phosphate synthase [Campylobacter cuniculorum]
MLDLSLYLVASRGNLNDESFLQHLENAIKGGVSIIQLREKTLNAREFYKLALKVKKLTRAYKIPLIINDRLDIALAMDADGVHLGQEDLEVRLARKLLGQEKIIGLSLKKPKQLDFIAGATYLGCGAIKPTPTKESEVLALKDLKKIIALSPLPVVAIGGIDENVVHELKGLKLAGIAVVRAIMEAKNPFLAARRLKKLFKEC